MFRNVVLVGAVLAGISPASSSTLFGAGAGMEISYYQTSSIRSKRDGVMYFGVDGYVKNNKTQEVVPFRALFDCGRASQIVVDMARMKKVLYVIDKVKYSQTNLGNWYALQSAHCPNNHHLKAQSELKYE